MAPEETKTETKTETKAEVKPEARPETKPAKQPEKQTNCPACGKPIKKIKRYYRNGKYYCNKKCWKKSLQTKT